MSEVSCTVSYKSAKMIISFIKFITENIRNNINMSGCYWKLSEIEDEMRKYKNKECDPVIELCQEMKENSYYCRVDVMFELSNFIQTVKPIISDEIFEKLVHETSN